MSGLGRIYKRGDIFWIDYSFRGKRHRESSGSTRKGDAKKLLRERTAEMGRGRIVGPDQESLTFDDLATIITDEYAAMERKSVDRLEVSLKALRSFFGEARVLEITTDRVDAYIRYRRDAGRANSTIRNEVNALRRAMALAAKAGKLTNVPQFNTPPVRAVRRGFFSRDDLNNLLRHLPNYLRPLVRFAYLTGWRKREILP